MPLDFQDHFSKTVSLIDVELDRLLTPKLNAGEIERPSNLVKAMRHGVLNGGKRLRPFLVIEVGALFGASTNETLLCGCALECLHSYSLVHDDLPAMDDDDLRRGLPTVHKAFDEATAILAGDALLTVAFDILSSPKCHPAADVRCELVSLLARAAGQGGMIGGQVLDIEAETSAPDAHEIRILQSMKTGALIRFACEAGAVLGGASKEERQNMADFGKTIGLAFQLADDLLDVTSSSEDMGKRVGKDAEQGKGTLVGLYGIEKTRSLLNESLNEAEVLLRPFGDEADILRQTARFVVERSN